MEQNATATMPVMDSGKQNSGKGLKIATAIASVVAVCGIGFGAYGMVQSSQKDNQISDLKVQIENNDGTKTTIETPKIETSTEDGITITITDSAVKNENAEDYIYIGEWGTKIKKPEPNIVDNATQDKSIAGISYATDGYRLYIWGTVYRNGDQAAGEGVMYEDNEYQIKSPYLAKVETVFTDNCLNGDKIGELNGKTLCYVESSDETLKKAFGDGAMERYIRPTLEILRDNFTDMNNYSTI